MAAVDPAARNQRLNDLVTSTNAWASQQITELQARADSSKAILQGRTGSEHLANAAVTAAHDIVVSDINNFLTGVLEGIPWKTTTSRQFLPRKQAQLLFV